MGVGVGATVGGGDGGDDDDDDDDDDQPSLSLFDLFGLCNRHGTAVVCYARGGMQMFISWALGRPGVRRT